MKRLFLLCVVAMCVVFSFRAQGQETISIGERHTLFSRLLNEERAYWVYQPEKRPGETERNYPVLYLLDGDSFFHTVVGFTRFFSSSRVSSLPPCVVVAVLNTDRTRDLTPTPSAARRDGTVRSGDEPKGGGAEQFYRAQNYNIILPVNTQNTCLSTKPAPERDFTIRIPPQREQFAISNSVSGIPFRHNRTFACFCARLFVSLPIGTICKTKYDIRL